MIRLAQTDAEIDACWPVMSRRCPHVPCGAFVARVRRPAAGGCTLACLEEDGRIAAVAGFRPGKTWRGGRYPHGDDLVTDAAGRRGGPALRPPPVDPFSVSRPSRRAVQWRELGRGVAQTG